MERWRFRFTSVVKPKDTIWKAQPTLPLAGEARVRILQITDTHLFAQSTSWLGVNTWESYQAVLEVIRPHQHEFDLIVATGDLAQDQSSAGLSAFR